jgi:hypothetical protein
MDPQGGGEMMIRCPSCTAPTASLKRYTMCELLVFVGIFAFTRRSTCTQCPGCMRKTILTRTAYNLITANLLWPIVVLPWHTVLFCMTYSKGHSNAVKALLME